jgi:hypothetical protein
VPTCQTPQTTVELLKTGGCGIGFPDPATVGGDTSKKVFVAAFDEPDATDYNRENCQRAAELFTEYSKAFPAKLVYFCLPGREPGLTDF